MIIASHDYSYCVTERVAQDKNIVYENYEITFSFSSNSEEDLRSITKINICKNYWVYLDWDTGLVKHPTGHNDPIFIYNDNGINCFQIIYYEQDLLENPENINVKLYYENDSVIKIQSVFLKSFTLDNKIPSKLISCNSCEKILVGPHTEPFEVVIQGMKNGSFFEERKLCDSNKEYVFDIPIWHSDYYGVCLSSIHKTGGFEHKYMLMGNFGNGSGRHLLTRYGEILSPRVIGDYKMKSLLIHYTGHLEITSDFLDSLLKNYREIEIALDLCYDFDIDSILNVISNNKRLSYFFIRKDINNFTITYPDGSVERSNFILQDIESKKDLIKSFENDLNSKMDNSWFSNNSFYNVFKKSYGVSFCYYYKKSNYQKDIIFNERRKVNPKIPCSNCHFYKKCEMVFPFPFNSRMLEKFLEDRNCLLKENFFEN